MLDQTKIQLPVITNGLTDKEIRIHLLVLAINCKAFPSEALDQAKEWSNWVINNK